MKDAQKQQELVNKEMGQCRFETQHFDKEAKDGVFSNDNNE